MKPLKANPALLNNECIKCTHSKQHEVNNNNIRRDRQAARERREDTRVLMPISSHGEEEQGQRGFVKEERGGF